MSMLKSDICQVSNAYVDPWDMLNNFCFHAYAQKSLFIGENLTLPYLRVHRAGSQLKSRFGLGEYLNKASAALDNFINFKRQYSFPATLGTKLIKIQAAWPL